MRKIAHALAILSAFGAVAIVGGCTASQINTTNTVVSDAQAVVADLSATEQQLQEAGVSATDLQTISTGILKINADIANLGTAANGATTILSDINGVIADIEPFAPEITALLGIVTAAAPSNVHVHFVKPATLSSLQANYTQFKRNHIH